MTLAAGSLSLVLATAQDQGCLLLPAFTWWIAVAAMERVYCPASAHVTCCASPRSVLTSSALLS